MKRMFTALLLAFALPLAAQESAKQEPPTRFAFFTVGLLVQHSTKAKAIFSELENLQKSLNDALKAKGAEGQKIQQQLQGSSLSEQGRDALKKQLRDIEIDYKKLQEDSQEQFGKVQQKVMGQIFQQVGPLIENLAKERKLQVVLSGESAQAGQLIHWADEKWVQEFTLEIAKRLDASPAVAAAAKPAAVPPAAAKKPAVKKP
ncbi:MAG TPA: OmpH family outer membrane protein [Holophaga sp.]|nr:OmpH family outer membrane protein [Holophaga sp.]HPS66417.1 OmpH family outer membrane protein [Holophaga sp.]